MATAGRGQAEPSDIVASESKITRRPEERGIAVFRNQIVIVIVHILMASVYITYGTVLTQYLVDRLAREAGYPNLTSVDHCTSNASDLNTKHANEIQKQVTDLSTNFSFVQKIPAFFACFLVGSFSDYIGRRVMLLLPIFTEFVLVALICLVIKFDLDLNLMYAGFALDGIAGSWPAIFLMEYAITADLNASKDSRTAWMFLIPCTSSIVLAGTMVTSSYLIQALGFFYASLLLAVMALFNFLIPFFLLQNTLVQKPATRVWNPLFHCRRLFGLFVSEGTKRRRATLLVCLLIFVFTVANELNISNIDSLYQLHEPFCWDSLTIGEYTSIRYGAANIAGAILLPVLRRFLPTEVLAMVGVAFQASAYGFEGFITEPWQFYIVPGLLIPNSWSVPIIRSMLSLLVSSDQQGALFSSVAVVETFCSLTTSVAYNQLYGATVRTRPGSVYHLMLSSAATAVFFFIIYFVIREKPEKKKEKDVLPPEAINS